MDIIKILNNDMSGLTDEEKFYADRFNANLREEIIDGLVIYEGNKIIEYIKSDKELFREKMDIIFVNGLRGFKDMPTKTLIDIFVEKCGEAEFMNIIEKVSAN